MTATTTRPPFSLIAHLGGKCPCCGSTDLQKQEVQKGEGAKWCCMNTDSCHAQLSSRIEHFCSRGCLDIEEIGGEVSGAIAAAVRDTDFHPADLPHWTAENLAALQWETVSGGTMTFGTSRGLKAYAALQRAKSLPLHRWIWGMGIRSIGENTSKEISRLARTPGELLNLGRLQDLTPSTKAIMCRQREAVSEAAKAIMAPFAISPRLGPDSATRLVNWLIKDVEVGIMAQLEAWGVKSDNYDPTPAASDAKPLFGKTFAITGTLSVGRDEMKALIESKGGKVSGSVSKNTNFLVAGEGGGQKADKARAAGVAILDEAALRAML